MKSYQDNLKWDSEWNPHLLEILNGNGDYQYAVVMGEETTSVWHIDRELDIQEIHWNSLTDLMLAAAECYETGAYSIDKDGEIEEDRQKMAEIRRKYNYQGSEELN
ncbi:MAG: hypothetical protein AAGF26_09485 [Cyanobacteria bacterium P01_G01_bin.49]